MARRLARASRARAEVAGSGTVPKGEGGRGKAETAAKPPVPEPGVP